MKNKNHQFESGQKLFQEHNERMRGFRKSHADVAFVNGVRHTGSALLENTFPLSVRQTWMEAGGSRLADDKLDWSDFVSILKVTGNNFSPN